MLRFVSRSYLDSDDGACLVDAGSWVLRRLTSGLMFCDLRDSFLLSHPGGAHEMRRARCVGRQ